VREEGVENSSRGLHLVEAPAVETIETGAPLLEGAELEEVCRVNLDELDLEMSREKLEAILHHEPKRFVALVKALCKRDYDHFLPVKDSSSFAFQRFVRECNRLKKSVSGLLPSLNDASLSDEVLRERSQRFLPDVARLLALQARSGHYLRLEYYPVLLEQVASGAKSQVLRDLIRRKSQGEQVAPELVAELNIYFQDKISYLSDLDLPMGTVISNTVSDDINVLVPEHMDQQLTESMQRALTRVLGRFADVRNKEASQAKEGFN